ncbi:Protein disulfide-isomerase erp38 [Lachnellula suecica]|uniref:protein disulfide-isomerase n=1 Tax=Lachnellula suecica TaxID=602035 RepID=A0A8T9C1Q2_9HELO|nr:Protein disulfide-isomerase erp38 [Lachnellula suecica]
MVQLLKSLVLAGLATVSLAKGPSVPPNTYDKSAVLDLIPDNFDKIAISGKPALVEFFAPWCGHCKTLAPIYEQLAQDFSFAKDKVAIAKVDADSEKSLGKRFGIQGFPTIKYFDGKSDKPEDYSGGRDLESLTEFITKKTGVKPKKAKAAPSQVEMLNDQTFKAQIGGDKDVLVAFTAPWCGHCKSLAPVWEKFAADFTNEPDVLIAKVDAEAENAKATAQDQGVSSYPTIKFFPKGSKEPEAYNGGRTEADLVAFINEKAGTHRAVGGGLDAVAGTIEALDTLVSKFTGGSSIAEVAAEATEAAKSLKEGAQYKYAEYYVKVFDKISKNDGYAAKELARLDNILKKGGLAPEKLDEFTSKTNILRRFVEKVTGKSEL